MYGPTKSSFFLIARDLGKLDQRIGFCWQGSIFRKIGKRGLSGRTEPLRCAPRKKPPRCLLVKDMPGSGGPMMFKNSGLKCSYFMQYNRRQGFLSRLPSSHLILPVVSPLLHLVIFPSFTTVSAWYNSLSIIAEVNALSLLNIASRSL